MSQFVGKPIADFFMQNKKQQLASTHTHTHTHEQGVMAKNMTTSKLCFDMIEEMDLMEKQHQ